MRIVILLTMIAAPAQAQLTCLPAGIVTDLLDCCSGAVDELPPQDLDLDTELPTADTFLAQRPSDAPPAPLQFVVDAVMAAFHDCGEAPCGPIALGENRLRSLCDPTRGYYLERLSNLVDEHADETVRAGDLRAAAEARCVEFLLEESRHCRVTKRRSSRSGGAVYDLRASGVHHPAASICTASKAHWPPQDVLQRIFESRPSLEAVSESRKIEADLEQVRFIVGRAAGKLQELGMDGPTARRWIGDLDELRGDE